MAGKARTRLRHHRWGSPSQLSANGPAVQAARTLAGGVRAPERLARGVALSPLLTRTLANRKRTGKYAFCGQIAHRWLPEARAEEGSTALPARQPVVAPLPSPHLCGTGWEGGTRTK